MTFEEIKEYVLHDPSYNFIWIDKDFSRRIVVLGLGGSYAYGTNNENSDIDIRGAAMNSREELLLGKDFGQIVDTDTDTTIYSLRKLINLLAEGNPNTIEILGLNDDQLILTTPAWEKIRENMELFLSKALIDSFGGYANAQLRRLDSKSARAAGQAQREKYIIGSIENAAIDFKTHYARMDEDAIRLYIDGSEKEDMDLEIFIDCNVRHYPLRDFASLVNDYHSVIRGYDRIGKRNKHAIEHEKLGKHMMHLVRLYYMCFDILEKHEINTLRVKEHDELMAIRNGKYLNEDKSVKPEFQLYVDELDRRLKEDALSTTLPDSVDRERIDRLTYEIIDSYIKKEGKE